MKYVAHPYKESDVTALSEQSSRVSAKSLRHRKFSPRMKNLTEASKCVHKLGDKQRSGLGVSSSSNQRILWGVPAIRSHTTTATRILKAGV